MAEVPSRLRVWRGFDMDNIHIHSKILILREMLKSSSMFFVQDVSRVGGISGGTGEKHTIYCLGWIEGCRGSVV